MKIIYLYPRSGQVTNLRSDTLWGLICWGIRYVWDEEALKKMINLFLKRKPPFLVSSAFPFSEYNGKINHFYPKPFLKPFQMNEDENSPDIMKFYKRYKKVRFVPEGIFRDLIMGTLNEKEYFLDKKRLWEKSSIITGIREVIAHNSINRLTNTTLKEGGLYNKEEFFYPINSGLFFLIDYLDNEYKEKVEALWPFFEHMGMGGDASTGKNSYSIRSQDYNAFSDIEASNRWVNLSLYHPTKTERKVLKQRPDEIWYQMEMRRGKIGGRMFRTPYIHKQGIQMFTEGSCFPEVGDDYAGEINLVKDVEELEHKVYQYGYAFKIPCQ